MENFEINIEIGGQPLAMKVKNVDTKPEAPEGYRPVIFDTDRGEIVARFYRAAPGDKAVIWIGGVGGDWDSPAEGRMYSGLSRRLTEDRISSLRIMYRHPDSVPESVLDTLAGLNYLQYQEEKVFGIVGHSLGGAVAIQAALREPLVHTVVALASQTYYAREVGDFRDFQSIIFIQGRKDEVIPYTASTSLFDRAHQPKKIILYDNAGHSLDEVAEEVIETVRDWLLKNLV